ncbi:MAG: hypothetical protein ABIN25_03685 [Ginsengibacter sp.]
MKKTMMVTCIILFFVTGCNNVGSIDKSDPLESGRGFIAASLKGDYTKAEQYILKDSTNTQYLDGLRDFNKNSSPIEREGYRDANIIIDSSVAQSDSINIIYFSNTFKKVPQKLKVVKMGSDWLVDFKYSFNENPIITTQ